MKLFERGGKRGSNQQEPVENLRFDARCPAGHRIEGERSREFQAIRCPECGEGIFILPTSWLPVPPAARINEIIPLHAVGLARVVEADTDDDEVELEEPAENPDTESGKRAGKPIRLKDHQPKPASKELSDDPAAKYQVQEAASPSDAQLTRLARMDADQKKLAAEVQAKPMPKSAEPSIKKDQFDDSDPEDDDPAGQPGRPFLRRPSPRVAIGLGVILVIGLTVFMQLRQRHREQLPHLAQRGRTEGLQKLKDGKFDEAKMILGAAADAYMEMKDNSETARQIIHASREAAILADLVGRPMEEILDRFAAGGAGVSEFESLDKGRSLVVESRVIATPENGGRYDIDYRVAVGPGPSSARPLGRLDLDRLKLMKDLKPAVGDSILIGVRLENLELADGQWLVRLAPDSGVQLTNWDALATLGWPVTERQKKDEAP